MERARWMLLCVGLALLWGCGPDYDAAKPPPPGKSKRKAAAAQPGPEPESRFTIDPDVWRRWDRIRPFFERYTRSPLAGKRNVFRSHLDEYVRPIEITVQEEMAEQEQEQEELAEIEPQDRSGPRKFAAQKYEVIMILSGQGLPKAVLEDPQGNAYLVRRNSEVGNRRGIVEAITQYEVVIREPETDEAIRLSAKPDFLELVEQGPFSAR